jgi:DNA-binding MarR family transcriptional regulator
VSSPLPFDPIAEARRQWRERWGERPATPMAAVTSIMRAQQILIAELNGMLRKHGLTFPRYEALVLLHFSRRGSLPLGKMGERLQVHRTSVTNLVDGLEKAGFVRRRPHDTDRRATLAEITDRGREVVIAATEELNAAGFCLDALPRDDVDAVTHVLAKLRKDAGDFE